MFRDHYGFLLSFFTDLCMAFRLWGFELFCDWLETELLRVVLLFEFVSMTMCLNNTVSLEGLFQCAILCASWDPQMHAARKYRCTWMDLIFVSKSKDDRRPEHVCQLHEIHAMTKQPVVSVKFARLSCGEHCPCPLVLLYLVQIEGVIWILQLLPRVVKSMVILIRTHSM